MGEQDADELLDRLVAEYCAAGKPTAWFDEFYAAGAAGTVEMPWSRMEPHPILRDWVAGRSHEGRAVVVGCALGADAEFLAGLGYRTTAFDILDLPAEWRSAVPTSRTDWQESHLHANRRQEGGFPAMIDRLVTRP